MIHQKKSLNLNLWLIIGLLVAISSIVLLIASQREFRNTIENLESDNKKLSEELNRYIIDENETSKISNYIIYLQPKLDKDIAILIANKIKLYSKEYNFPASLITSLMYRESSFNPISISSAKCIGLMQINPLAHQDKIQELKLEYHDLFKIDNNINLGCMILSEYYQSTKDIEKALTKYVGGTHESYVIDILNIYTNYQIDYIQEQVNQNISEEQLEHNVLGAN